MEIKTSEKYGKGYLEAGGWTFNSFVYPTKTHAMRVAIAGNHWDARTWRPYASIAEVRTDYADITIKFCFTEAEYFETIKAVVREVESAQTEEK